MPHNAMLTRIRAEYLEMPGLRLTLTQAQRLCGVEGALCQPVLDALVEAKFLCVKPDGVYARVTDGVDHPYQPLAKDDLRTSRRVQPAREFAHDWPILWTARPNVLVVGRADAVEQSLAAFTPHLDPPVCYWTPGAVLPSPGDVKTLVIRSVDALSAEQQRDVSSWLEQAAGERTPVVSTTTVPLFQRMVAGLFLDVLYYRLNTVVLDARATAGADHSHPHPAKADLRAEWRAEAS